MKILIVNDNTLDQTNGVVTTFVNVLNYLDQQGIEYVYLDPSHFRSVKGWFYPDLSIPLNVWKFAEFFDQFNPTHVHIGTEGVLGLTAKLYLDRHRLNYTTSFHTRWDLFAQAALGFAVPGMTAALRKFHSRSKRVLVTTNGMAEEVAKLGIHHTLVWSRGVDHHQFSFGQGSCNSKPTLLSVGRVSAEKNLDVFCELDPQKYTLVMVGDGPYLPSLQNRYPHVNFVGMKKNAELAQAYQAADVFVFPSRSDTFGLVMIEAMSCGTPVAAYPVRGPVDVVDHNHSGFLDNDLEHAIQQCLTLDRAAVRQASFKWNWHSVSAKFVSSLEPVT